MDQKKTGSRSIWGMDNDLKPATETWMGQWMLTRRGRHRLGWLTFAAIVGTLAIVAVAAFWAIRGDGLRDAVSWWMLMAVPMGAILGAWMGSKRYARTFFEIRGETWPGDQDTAPDTTTDAAPDATTDTPPDTTTDTPPDATTSTASTESDRS